MYYPSYQISIKQVVYSLKVGYQQNYHALNLAGGSVKILLLSLSYLGSRCIKVKTIQNFCLMN